MRLPAWVRLAWVLPATFLALFVVAPLAALAVAIGEAPSLPPATLAVAGSAAAQAALSTLAALMLGLPLAATVARYRFPGQSIALALVTVPFVLPTVVVALALRSVIGGSGGLAAVVIAHAYVNLAVIVRIVGAQWRQLDPRAAQVARTLGATPARAFATVTLPGLLPSLASAAAIVFAYSFGSLGIVALLGEGSVRTLETQVVRQSTVLLDFPAAAATAAAQAVVVAAALAIAAAASRRGPQRTAVRPLLPLPTGPARAGILAVAIVGAAVSLAPVVALTMGSIGWWGAIWSVDAGTDRIGSPAEALARSLGYALATGVIAATIGGAAAVSMLGGRAGRFIAVAAVVPLGISAATLGLGTLLAFGRAPLDLRGTGLLIPLAHAVVAVPLVVAIAAPALRAADRRTLAVAATLGARPSRAFLTAYGSILRTVMVGAGALAAAVSLGEFGAASVLARAGEPTLPIQVARLLSRPGEASIGTASALGVLLVALTVAIVIAVDRQGRRA